MIFMSKIDKLIKEQSKLKIKKQKIEDRKNARNSSIERKMDKLEDLRKQYQDQAQVTYDKAKAQIAEIERKIEKNQNQIKLERDYYNAIVKDEGGINE